jgi:CRP-like cAMP-binding protein
MNETGRELMTIEEGNFFGESEILEDVRRKYFAVAKTNITLILFRKDIIKDLLKRYKNISVLLKQTNRRRQR